MVGGSSRAARAGWGIALVFGAAAGGGCSGGRVVTRQAPPAGAIEPAPEPDPFDRFTGQKVPAGEPFRLGNEPVGVEGPRVVVALSKTEWTVFPSPRGEEKLGTATIVVQRGEEAATVRVEKGKTGRALGVAVEVREVGDQMVEGRWLAFADVVVSAE